MILEMTGTPATGLRMCGTLPALIKKWVESMTYSLEAMVLGEYLQHHESHYGTYRP